MFLTNVAPCCSCLLASESAAAALCKRPSSRSHPLMPIPAGPCLQSELQRTVALSGVHGIADCPRDRLSLKWDVLCEDASSCWQRPLHRFVFHSAPGCSSLMWQCRCLFMPVTLMIGVPHDSWMGHASLLFKSEIEWGSSKQQAPPAALPLPYIAMHGGLASMQHTSQTLKIPRLQRPAALDRTPAPAPRSGCRPPAAAPPPPPCPRVSSPVTHARPHVVSPTVHCTSRAEKARRALPCMPSLCSLQSMHACWIAPS